ncbi:MAG: hypothetical protein ACYC6F_06075 [Longimicrobiales bacterium]
MRNFEDSNGTTWTANAAETPGTDYKGRRHMVMRRADGAGPELELTDVRWNNESTARRTLDTMSVVELRRRLRSALGRAAAPASA